MTTMAVAQRPRRLSETLHQWGMLLGIIGAFVGFIAGAQIGEHLVNADANSNNSNAALIIGYLGQRHRLPGRHGLPQLPDRAAAGAPAADPG